MREKRFLEDKGKRNPKIIILIALSIMLISIITSTIILRYQKCDDWECFNKNLQQCKRTKFAGGTDILFGYTIQGKSLDYCEIDLILLEGQLNKQDTLKLKGKEMTCNIPLGIRMLPESELSNCHGELKENLQEQIINDLHNYIIQNLGQVNGVLVNPLSDSP